MILFLQGSWAVFGLIAFGCFMSLRFMKRARILQPDASMATSSKQFFMQTVFFSFKKGEAKLFFSVLIGTISFYLFCIGFIKDLSSILFF